jgi:DNA mismatch repair ATPase MutS
VTNKTILEKLNAILHNFGDLERLISRIGSGKATTRDVVNLSYALDKLPQIKKIFEFEKSDIPINNNNKVSVEL